MISYCIACFRPVYSRQLICELVRKTAVAYEILVWLNLDDAGFDRFLADQIAAGTPLRILGRTAHNIGMAAYPLLFSSSRFEMVVQIDDDVICISPRLAETASEILTRFPRVGMLTADTWQDDYTNGARPPMEAYREVDRACGLFDGPIDGWFAIYRRSSLRLCALPNRGRYHALGGAIKQQLRRHGQDAFLCTRIRVFHVTGPQYASYFGALESEIEKYARLGLHELVDCYRRQQIPPREHLAQRIDHIRASFEQAA